MGGTWLSRLRIVVCFSTALSRRPASLFCLILSVRSPNPCEKPRDVPPGTHVPQHFATWGCQLSHLYLIPIVQGAPPGGGPYLCPKYLHHRFNPPLPGLEDVAWTWATQ